MGFTEDKNIQETEKKSYTLGLLRQTKELRIIYIFLYVLLIHVFPIIYFHFTF